MEINVATCFPVGLSFWFIPTRRTHGLSPFRSKFRSKLFLGFNLALVLFCFFLQILQRVNSSPLNAPPIWESRFLGWQNPRTPSTPGVPAGPGMLGAPPPSLGAFGPFTFESLAQKLGFD